MASKADLHAFETRLNIRIKSVEQHGGIMQHQINNLSKDMQAGFAQIEKRFLKVEERLLKLEERILKVEERLLALASDIENLSLKLTIRLGGMMCASFSVLAYLSQRIH